MKILMEFNLPDDREDFDLANKAAWVAARIDDFDNWMRGYVKYQERETWPDLETVRSEFWKIMKED